MQQGQLFIYPDGTESEPIVTLSHVERTETIAERTKGLLGRAELKNNEALWITPCNSVHTMGMKYQLDILYIDRNHLVKKIVQHLPPRRMSWCMGAQSTIELKSGTVKESGIRIGNRVKWVGSAS